MKRKTHKPSTLREFLRRNRRILLAYATFFLCLGGFAGLLIWVLGNDNVVMTGLQKAFANATSFVLGLLGNGTSVDGTAIVSERFTLHIIPACTGTFVAAAFLSAVLAYPARWCAKLIGVLLGITAIGVLNIIRLTSLFYIGTYFPRFFDQAHLLVWQSLIIVFLLFLWLVWANKATHVSNKK